MECGHHGGTSDEPFLTLRWCWQSEGSSQTKPEATALKPFYIVCFFKLFDTTAEYVDNVDNTSV